MWIEANKGIGLVKPYTDVKAAIEAVAQFCGPPEDFRLPISDEIQDPVGITMALITDVVVSKGWDLDGFEQHDGYRVYKYKSGD